MQTTLILGFLISILVCLTVTRDVGCESLVSDMYSDLCLLYLLRRTPPESDLHGLV